MLESEFKIVFPKMNRGNMPVKNQNFRQKSKFSSKIKIFVKNKNFGQK